MAGEEPDRKVYELSILLKKKRKKKKKALPEGWRRRGVTSGTQTGVRELPQKLSDVTVTIAGSWVCGHIFSFCTLYVHYLVPIDHSWSQGSIQPQLLPLAGGTPSCLPVLSSSSTPGQSQERGGVPLLSQNQQAMAQDRAKL